MAAVMPPRALAVARFRPPRGAARLVTSLAPVAARSDDLRSLGNVTEEDRRLLAGVVAQEESAMEDVDPADLPFPVRERQAASDLREFARRLLVEVELIAEAALEPATGAGDLR